MHTIPPSSSGQGVSPLFPETSARKKKRKHDEIAEVGEKNIPRESLREEKKFKRSSQKIEPSKGTVAESVDSVSEKVLPSTSKEPRKRKRETEEEVRKKPKTGLLPNEALIRDLSSKKFSNDPETIIACLNTLYDQNMLSAKDSSGGDFLLKYFLLVTSREKFSEDHYYRLNDLLIKMYPHLHEDELKKELIRLITSYTVSARCQDLVKNLHFIKEFSTTNFAPTINKLFNDIFYELPLEQKHKIMSFIDENEVSIDNASWAEAFGARYDKKFINTLREIPSKERAAFFRDNPILFTGERFEHDLGKLLKILYTTPPEERTSLIDDTEPLFNNKWRLYDRNQLLAIMSKIPHKERKRLIQDTLPLLDTTMGWPEKQIFLNVVHEIPSTNRAQLIQEALPLFDSTMEVGDRSQFLKILYKTPQAERASIIRITQPLFDDAMDWYKNFQLIEKTLDIPISERAALIQDASLLCNNTMSQSNKINLLKELGTIPHSERSLLIQDTIPLFTDDMRWEEKVELVKAMLKIPHAARAALIQDTTPLFKDDTDWQDKVILLETMHKIKPSERETLIQDTLPFFDDAMGVYQKTALLEVINSIRQPERSTLFQDSFPLLQNITNGFDKSGLLYTIYHTIPQAERTHAIADTMPLVKENTTAKGKAALLKVMSTIPRADRSEVIQDASSLFTVIPPGATEATMQAKFLATIHSFSKEKRGAFIGQVMPLLPTLISAAWEDPLVIFYLLPDSLKTEERLRVLEEGGVLKDAEYQAAILFSLERELVDEQTSPLMLRNLAEFIIDVSATLKIHEEHPLIQKAIELLSASEVGEKKNPFALYGKLQKLAKEPTSFQPKEDTVAKQKTAFRLDQLQASGKAFEVARVELPQDATQEVWNQLTNDLKQKVESNPAAKKQLEEMGTTWKELWEGCFADEYILGLLKLSIEKVPLVEAQFRALLHHLLVKEKTVTPGEIFSEQEKLLIMQGMSIQKCSGGKKEGIALTYKLLDPEFKYPAKDIAGGNPDEIRAYEFIADVVQKAIADQFSGTNALMQELTGVQNIEQAPHQAIYLKNLIGEIVGLTHKITFDMHTGTLYDGLLEKSQEEVLQAFFRHFTPQVLVKEFMRVVNNNFTENSKILRWITLGEGEIEREIRNNGFIMDDETFKMQINELGALLLLKKAGYLT